MENELFMFAANVVSDAARSSGKVLLIIIIQFITRFSNEQPSIKLVELPFNAQFKVLHQSLLA